MTSFAPTPLRGLRRTLATAAAAGLVVSAFGLAASAQAAPIISDGGFDDATITSSYCYLPAPQNVGVPNCISTLPGWTSNAIVVASGNGAWGGELAHDGSQFVALQTGASNGYQQISQTLSLAAGHYTLSWWDAGRTNVGGNATYAVMYNGLQLGSYTTTTADWVSHSLALDLSGATTGNLVFKVTGGTQSDNTSFIDQVALTSTPVPEPASFALVALALAGLPVLRRRQPAKSSAA